MNTTRVIYIFAAIMLLLNVIHLYNEDVLTMKQMLIANTIASVIMMIMTAFYGYKLFKAIKAGVPYNFPQARVVIPRARIGYGFLRANADLLKNNIVPTNPFRACILRISMEISDSIEQLGISAMRLRECKIIENTTKMTFYAYSKCTIDTLVFPNETVNFKFDNDIHIVDLLIDELYIP